MISFLNFNKVKHPTIVASSRIDDISSIKTQSLKRDLLTFFVDATESRSKFFSRSIKVCDSETKKDSVIKKMNEIVIARIGRLKVSPRLL